MWQHTQSVNPTDKRGGTVIPSRIQYSRGRLHFGEWPDDMSSSAHLVHERGLRGTELRAKETRGDAVQSAVAHKEYSLVQTDVVKTGDDDITDLHLTRYRTRQNHQYNRQLHHKIVNQ